MKSSAPAELCTMEMGFILFCSVCFLSVIILYTGIYLEGPFDLVDFLKVNSSKTHFSQS